MPQFNRRRERELPPPSGERVIGTLISRWHPSNQLYQTVAIKSPFRSFGMHEVTHDNKNIGPPYYTGGPFLSHKVYVDHNEPQGFGKYTTRMSARTFNSLWYEYTGGWVPPSLSDVAFIAAYHAAGGSGPNGGGYTPADLSDIGEEAFNRMKPKLEIGGISVALAEAREVPKMLATSAHGFHDVWKGMGGDTKSSIMQPKKIADHFLNHQFGWIPFIADLRRFNDVYQNSAAYMDRISKQNGLWIKKKVSLSGSSSSLETVNDKWTPGIGPGGDIYRNMMDPVMIEGQLSYGSTKRTSKTETSNWASGSWKYYRPEFDRSLPGNDSGWSNLQRQMMLHGARINPSVVWNATRWSWLIDWFSNVGAVIDRGTSYAYDGVVSRYMFLMSHSISSMEYEVQARFWEGARTFTWRNAVDVKFREEAGSPFGFTGGLPLTARQLAILGAIGLSRRP